MAHAARPYLSRAHARSTAAGATPRYHGSLFMGAQKRSMCRELPVIFTMLRGASSPFVGVHDDAGLSR